jgi:hypothetical protein
MNEYYNGPSAEMKQSASGNEGNLNGQSESRRGNGIPFVCTSAVVPLLSLCEHETFALLIYCVCSGGTGKPAVVYEGRAELCPSGFFYGSLRASSFESDIGK